MGAIAHIVVTPINPNPTTPRAKEIVEELRSRSPGYSSRSSHVRWSTFLAGMGATGSRLGDTFSTPPGAVLSDGPATHGAASPARESSSSSA
jgi:hypothetical protein